MRLGSPWLLSIAIALATCVSAQGATIIADGDGTSLGTETTFGAVERYQQVYNSDLFAEPVNISSIQFRSPETASLTANVYQIRVSTSVNSVNSLSSTFANNVGADVVLYETKSFTGTINAGDLYGFTGSFDYNPALGDLLIDITRISGTAQPLWSPYNALPAHTLGEYSRAYSFSGTTTGVTNSNYGNHTYFTTNALAPVPEPASLAIWGIGAVGGALVARRRKRLAA